MDEHNNKNGEWLEVEEDYPLRDYWICSECKKTALFDFNSEFVLSNYCPYCGAKMES